MTGHAVARPRSCGAPSHYLRDQAARLAPEAGLDQGPLHARADHRLTVESLDRQALDHPALSGLRELGQGGGEFLVAELLEPEDPLAAALDVEQRLAIPEHHVGARRPSWP